MNILEKNYPAISVKTDAEDLKVMIDFINGCAEILRPNHTDLKIKASVSLLQEIRNKFEMIHFCKKGTTKKFLIKLKAYQVAALLEIFSYNNIVNGSKVFEWNCIRQFSELFHQKLTGL